MKNMTVRSKIFWCYSILFIITLLLTVFISQKVVQKVFYDSVLQSYRREQVYTANQLQSSLEHLKDYQRTVSLDSVVRDTFSHYPQVLELESDIYNMNRTLRKRVTTIIGTNRDIYEYVFVTLGGTFLLFSDETSFQTSIGKFLGHEFFLKNNSNRGLVLNGPFEMKPDNGEQIRFFVLSKQVVDLNTLDPLGYVAFIIKEEVFSDIFENNMPLEIQSDFYLISEDMQILSSSDKETVGKNLSVIKGIFGHDLTQLKENGMCEVEESAGTLLYTMTKMEGSEWSVVHSTSMEALLSSQHKTRQIVIGIGFIACIFSLCFASVIARQITEPIVKLSHKMTNYHAAEEAKGMTADISRDEIKNLYMSFEYMVEKSDQLMRQIYIEQEEKSNYQLQLIQSQIKPHFLYNTLEMIKSLVDCQMYEEAGQAIMAMSRFYRLSLNSGNDVTSVAQEMELSKQYLCIQKMRYAEYMDYTVMECRGMEQYAIPKLTLQPLLENAIYHGIKEKQEDGRIKLTIQEMEKCFVFKVWDNGAGMDSEVLEKVRMSLSTQKKEKEGSFGLYSINRRLQLFFGTECRLEIESEQSVFTCVTVTIPKIHLSNIQEKILD